MVEVVRHTVTISGDTYDRMLAALEAYDAAAEKFIGKVDTGRATNVETYRELKAARELSRKAMSTP